MKFGVPWHSKGIRPEARETAREAARRSGMTLDDWLHSVILQQAAQAGVHGYSPARQEQHSSADLAAVNQRLDDLTRRIEHFTRTGPAAYAPRHQRPTSEQRADLIGRLDRRVDQFVSAGRQPSPPLAPAMPNVQLPPALGNAVAEIAARQRALNGEPVPARPHPQPAAPARAPLPAQDLSGLEDQLRKITDQIETLRKPGVEEAINALRGELGDIGRALNEAMPRQAIDAIERQIQGLSQRVAEGRQAGVDIGALSGIEQGLWEVRDALRGLTPAESLIGFNEAVAGLAQKIDLIVAEKDPATLQQLESAITTLRSMAGNVASNDAVSRLAADVQSLADKVDQIGRAGPHSDALSHLESRIDALSQALAERAQNGSSVPPRLEALVHSLSDKIEQIQDSRNDNVGMSQLEDRIGVLVERLDVSDSRLSHLEAIEHGLADLLTHIEYMRAEKQAAPYAEESPAVGSLKDDIARTQNALDAVHGTLGLVVDRLAVIEKGIRSEPPPPPVAQHAEPAELNQPVGKVAVRMVPAAPATAPADSAPQEAMPSPEPARQPAPAKLPQAATFTVPPAAQEAPAQPAAKRPPAAKHPPINPDLPPDQPLEPGSGAPHLRGNPAARIAASEADLGGVRPAGLAPTGQSDFIAAARRAAQAASQEPVSPPDAEGIEDLDSGSLRGRMLKRVKSLFVAASVAAIVVGSVQFGGKLFNFVGSHPVLTAQRSDDDRLAENAEAEAIVSEPATSPAPAPVQVAASTPLQPPGYNLLSPPALTNFATAPAAPSASPRKEQAAAAATDVTGSIPQAPHAKQSASAPHAPLNLADAKDDGLPPAIGSPRLRRAAVAGDAGAAYEVGVRFAEGRGVPVDMAEAARWYARAAAKGLAPAQFRYGSLLEKGNGVKKDLDAARRLYLAAAGQGNAKAMHNLAVLYAEGINGKPDYDTAAKWFIRAAQYGVSDSQYNLGILYARGIGVTKNLAESYKWFALAASRGDREAGRKRDEVGGRMSAGELANARAAIESFKVTPQPAVATVAPKPPGGWDKATAAPPDKTESHPRGSFKIGKR